MKTYVTILELAIVEVVNHNCLMIQ